MDSDVEGFSDTGMIVFGATLGGLALVIVVASFLTLLFARRHRFLKSCEVFLGGSVIATPIFIVAAFIAMYV